EGWCAGSCSSVPAASAGRTPRITMAHRTLRRVRSVTTISHFDGARVMITPAKARYRPVSCGARLASLDRRRGKRHAITRSRDLLFNSRVHVVRWGRLRIRQEYLKPAEWKGRRERETWTECQGHPFCGYLCRASFGSTRASHAATAASTGRG